MRIHHLNCISTCPLGGRLMDGRSRSILERGELACHCLLVELPECLVLVDTGLGRRDVQDPRSRLSAFFLTLLRPDFRDEMTAYRQVEALGFDPRDVRHIVLTHLDFDHAGGLDDFPWATVHLMAAERDYARLQRTWLDRQRFRPQQWSTQERWRAYAPDAGERWYGFDQVRTLDGLPPEMALVALPGHTFGHAGIAVQAQGEWLLQAGDAYFHHGELDPARPYCTPGLRFYQWMMEKDREARLATQRHLRELKERRDGHMTVCCGHDMVEFERLARRSARVPASAFATAP
ncbi:Zn-dependent hydrolase, including glyoxylase [Cupriavidus gilardii CR3]|uniref:MBL fold metallo-hydrolase n=1 Tax=Cupriavidus gilardii TaxID=82541 RepID=A0A849B858_9BURK|nr:MBL fold metallo-hydrolase [Cupriavidus gilardii]ALD92153.1 Zn-dependent hydrolase, including glyoxylase [Cupriavidus gilardii CR3]KAB0596936.1 MBL fold metallo-hydrolase [Cupriavidus gilardii]MCT9014915.1 MBL fold metallo-hydrolase [Cupriavidus gilardii]MCT9053327.1 MBL fold metallo-hydrolase [Cupriavidus gilardii]NNH10348.1 MBL fold metallo-hydrolase [Cupriavidus gilardii]